MKTLLAKALAIEAGANFISITGSTLTSKVIFILAHFPLSIDKSLELKRKEFGGLSMQILYASNLLHMHDILLSLIPKQ